MVFLPLLLAVNGALAAVPLVDFDRMGKVGLAGAFAGLDIYSNPPISFDPSTSTIFTRSSSGALTRLAATNSGGRINAACAINNIIYLAGTFTSINDVQANNVVSYSVQDSKFSSLGSGGPNGEVDTAFCDSKDSKVWVGGRFSQPGSAVAIWDTKAASWSKAPFGGLNGAQGRVSSITTNSTGSSLFFAGSFISSFGNGSAILNGTNNPNVPFSAGATPFSSSLVPIPLEGAQIQGSPSSVDPQFDNIESILCPSGSDGPGNTWFGADNTGSTITIRKFSFIAANGVRLGNTFQANHGTTGFVVTTIPDNTVQTLTYVDPTSGQNMSCSNPCPLSTDSSIPYQDFLFPSTLSITGVQIELSQFTGVAPGLHILQLLSSGAFASAIDADNSISCFAPNPSNTTRTGDWTAKVANTNIAGTVQTVLVSSVAAGTTPASGPSFTWMPYVSAAGQYNINLLVPGCTNFQDCDQRTSVQVTVFPGNGISPWSRPVTQTNTEDASTLIYSGPILPSSPDFVTTITMTLADNAANGPGPFEIVADRVQLILTSADVGSTSSSSSGAANVTISPNSGFGFLEWPLNSSGSPNADGILPESALTTADKLGSELLSAMGVASLAASTNTTLSAVVSHPSGIFVGGNFVVPSGPSNVLEFSNGALSSLAQGGLNGPVTSIVLVGDQLFVGGAFNDTASSSTSGQLRGIARYDIQQKSWNGLGGGVNGPVTSLNYADGQVQIAGTFTSAFSTTSASPGSALPVAGLATWDIASASWTNSGGFVIGQLTLVANATQSLQIVAGQVSASERFGASGMVFLQNGDSSGPQVSPLGIPLANAPNTSPASNVQRRSHVARTIGHSQLKFRSLIPRQSSTPTLPTPPSAPAPAVLAGAFWTNTTSSVQVTIIGGNFSFGQEAFNGVAIYNPDTSTARPLQGPQVNGTVHSLLVEGSTLYVGGQFTIQSLSVNGLAIYDLAKDTWDVSGLQALQAISGETVFVRSISQSTSKPNMIIVAGSFSQAGSLACEGICSFDSQSRQWNALGNGIQGEVASVAYAGNDQELLIASGAISLSSSGTANVAQYNIANATWVALGSSSELPGPVTAVEVNAGNASSIFAAGRSNDGSFLSFWDGATWATIDAGLQPESTVSQLSMVPLQNTHAGNSIIQADRVLMVSGSLSDSNFGTASSALFDGQTLIPYIVSESLSGNPGMVASLFRSFATFSFNQRHFLATGVVILISIAIAAGVVFLLALIGILWTLFSRRDDKVAKIDPVDDDDDESAHHRPSSLLEHINAATRTTILGTSAFGNYNPEHEEEKISRNPSPEPDPFGPGPDASHYVRADTPSDAVGGMLGEEASRPARARYSFHASGEGELSMTVGSELEILDDKDTNWWYARDARTGREGVVPASYVY
ncbi:hypothetical protein BDN72DRAFT_885763 [Pluteus cervinus]|uniref:Uncharacterized protein n=1 Tax=Pluteus cervinus TaxID=181527 RepID=A0ACD3BC46_9AGAR|nr:hypothetical protein BDN72DRAFT_885763 [Pluteus cervinus]